MSEKSSSTQGIGVLGFMFLILFTLKILGKITVSWWWVTAPLWGPVAAIAAMLLCWGLFMLFALLFYFIVDFFVKDK